MDKYTATELAFKHGYEKGYEAGKPKWIPVSERLPEKHDKCLVLVPSKLRGHAYFPWMVWYDPKSGFYDHDHDWGDIEMNDVTHWMPLPEPPKEGE